MPSSLAVIEGVKAGGDYVEGRVSDGRIVVAAQLDQHGQQVRATVRRPAEDREVP